MHYLLYNFADGETMLVETDCNPPDVDGFLLLRKSENRSDLEALSKPVKKCLEAIAQFVCYAADYVHDQDVINMPLDTLFHIVFKPEQPTPRYWGDK